MELPKKPICFVISPIGDKGSATRQLADDVFELLIEPALEKFAFSALRADKITSVESINKDVIEQIQNAELCIIDITGHNPNVMYECGRRHETGKPYVMIAKDGERLPFDITTIRTIFYGLTNGREIRVSVKAIQDAVGKIVADGFQSEGSGESLASLADAIRRIERALDRLATPASAPSANAPSPRASQLIKQYGPVAALNYAFSQRDADLVDEILPRLPKKKDDRNFIVGGLAQGAAIGSRVAFDMLVNRIGTLSSLVPEDVLSVIGCLGTGANRLDEEEKVLSLLEPFFDDASEGRTGAYSSENRAFLLNQKQRLLHGMGRTKEALEIGERVLDLCPNDISYLFNQSINCEAENNLDRALELVDRYMLIVRNEGAPDEDHLQRAVRIYAKAGQKGKALDAYRLLQQHHPYIADLLKEDDELGSAID